MAHLVALDLPGGPRFVDELRRAWDAGDAVLPVDRRLPAPARAALLAAMAPTAIIDESGRHHLPDGRPVEPGVPGYQDSIRSRHPAAPEGTTITS